MNMLMGFAEVSREGEFIVKGDLRVLYTTMMYIRLLLIKDAVTFSIPAVLIGIRYGVVRR